MRGRAWLVPLVLLVLAGCSGSTPAGEPAAPRSTPRATTLASYDAAGTSVVRGPFCDRVSPTGIEHALGDVPDRSDSWANGDRVPLPDGTRDRVHEYGCSWTAADGTEARAWVFAPPVTKDRARSLADETPGSLCRRLAGQPFGTPSSAVSCRVDGDRVVRFAGRFGDGWLTCELTGRPVAVTSSWCVAVLEAARA